MLELQLHIQVFAGNNSKMGTAAQEGTTPTRSSSLHSASLELYLGLSSKHQDDRIHLQIWDCSTRKPHQLRARYMSLAQLTAVTAPALKHCRRHQQPFPGLLTPHQFSSVKQYHLEWAEERASQGRCGFLSFSARYHQVISVLSSALCSSLLFEAGKQLAALVPQTRARSARCTA